MKAGAVPTAKKASITEHSWQGRMVAEIARRKEVRPNGGMHLSMHAARTCRSQQAEAGHDMAVSVEVLAALRHQTQMQKLNHLHPSGAESGIRSRH